MRAPTTPPTRVPTPKRAHEKWIVDGAFRVRRAGKNKSKLTDGAIDVIAVRARLFGPLSVPSSEIGIVIEMLSGERPKAASASGRGRESLPKDDFPKTPAAFREREGKSHKKAPFVCRHVVAVCAPCPPADV